MAKMYTVGEEIFNAISHGVGAGLAVIGTIVLVVIGIVHGRIDEIVAFSIYGLSLISLYVLSTVYHAVPSERAKPVLRVIDHASISPLIAGTYTPFALVTLRSHSVLGWFLFAGIWALAALTMALNIVSLRRFQSWALVLYITMGWLALLFLRQVLETIGLVPILLLALGGIFYTTGVFFYKWKRLKFSHGIWHLFVLAGSLVHYIVILKFV